HRDQRERGDGQPGRDVELRDLGGPRQEERRTDDRDPEHERRERVRHVRLRRSQPERRRAGQEGETHDEPVPSGAGGRTSTRRRRTGHRLRDPSTPATMARHMAWVALVLSLLVILLAAELFTNGVEWVGEGFGLSQGVVGSVLAAVGTALPETLLPLVAILSGHEAGEQIGIGAILGAPFMLTTLAMVVIAVSVLYYSRGGARSLD